MIKVALVGNIASGKSTVESILEQLGYEVLDTDAVCHNLLVSMPQVAQEFSAYDVFTDGKICRDKLGKLVFNNPELLKKLENILYPQLKQEINKFFDDCKERMAFVAIPLLFEANMENLFDKILFVYCDDNIRIKRLITRNNYSEEYAKLRMSMQISQDEKLEKADVVIYNNSTVEDLAQSVSSALEQIR